MGWDDLVTYVQRFIRSKILESSSSMLTVIEEDRYGEKGVKDDFFYPADAQILIFYGSQFGEMRTIALKFAETCKSLNFNVKLISLENFKPKMLRVDKSSTVVIVITSTYGHGGPPDNAQYFYDWLKKESTRFTQNKVKPLSTSITPEKPSLRATIQRIIQQRRESTLKGIHYSVFGGGSSFYDHFCGMAKFVDSTFENMGAKRIHPPSFGDAAKNNTEIVYKAWSTSLIKFLSERIIAEKAQSNRVGANMVSYLPIDAPHFVCNTISDGPKPFTDPIRSTWGNPIAQNQHFFACQTMQVTRLEPAFTRKQDCPGILYLRLTPETNTANSNILDYQAAGIMQILISNDSKLVDRMSKLLALNLDDHIQVIPITPVSSIPFPITSTYTIRQLLTSFVDLANVSQGLLERLIHYATDKRDIDELERLSSSQGQAAYESTYLRSKKTLPDVLRDFTSVEITFEQLLHVCDYLRPKFFTISSSSKYLPNQIDLTISCPWLDPHATTVTFSLSPVMMFFKKLYMEKVVNPNQVIRLKTHTSSSPNFYLPNNPVDSIICIAMGSAIAPMRAIIQERIYTNSSMHGTNILFYGCRNQHSLPYECEIREWERLEQIQLYLAYSRDQSDAGQGSEIQAKKSYVQDILPDNKELIQKHVRQHNSHIYISGKKDFLKSVRIVIEEVLRELYLENEQGVSMVEKLIQAKRYHEEGWG